MMKLNSKAIVVWLIGDVEMVGKKRNVAWRGETKKEEEREDGSKWENKQGKKWSVGCEINRKKKKKRTNRERNASK